MPHRLFRPSAHRLWQRQGDRRECGRRTADGQSDRHREPHRQPHRFAESDGQPTRLTDDQAERRALVPAATVTWDKAADTAVGEVAGSKLVEIELTRYQSGGPASPSPSPASPSPSPSPSPGAPAWAVDVATEDGTVHTVHVDAASGQVLGSRQESDQSADEKRRITDRLAQAKTTPEQAVQTATGRTDGTVTAVELDNDDADKLIWSVDVVTQADWNKTTFDIDATNGKILREQVDRD
ncbi:PepSY domain-containing protein [Streptomyces sp. NPDC002835]